MEPRDVSVRELRNQISAVLRRVEGGERLRITVDRRPVAELVPLSRRRRAVPWGEFAARLPAMQADAVLADDLRAALPDTTDDL